MKHFSFPEIVQFRQVIRYVSDATRFTGLDENGDPIFDYLKPLPKIKFRGSVKLHGSNASIVKNLVTGEIYPQSRSRVLSVEDDNYGFAKFMSEVDTNKLFDMVKSESVSEADNPDNEDVKDSVIIYGEWCGGSIQKGVAITKLDKMFVIFAIKNKGVWMTDDEIKKVKLPESRIFNILDFPHFHMEIDFQNPEEFQNKLGEITLKVEEECPVAKQLGAEGVGEGIVWIPVDSKWNRSKFWFKVKGEKHSSSKVKTLAAVDIEKVNSVNDLLDKVVTHNRLMQGVEFVKAEKRVSEIDRSHIGDFIRWVFNDVVKEETDTIEASGLEAKDLGGPIAKKAKEWLFKVMKV